MSLDCLVRESIYVKFCFTLAIPTLLIAFIQARAAAQQCTLKRNSVRAAKNRPALGSTGSLRALMSAKAAAKKIKERLARKKKKAATGLTFAVPSPLNGSL
eukprot:COSAG06_NODE_47862_length_336_cov_0.860759_1_plen_100_part_01